MYKMQSNYIFERNGSIYFLKIVSHTICLFVCLEEGSPEPQAGLIPIIKPRMTLIS